MHRKENSTKVAQSAPFLISNPDFEANVRLGKYEKGEQPCSTFKAQRESNGYAEWDNVHCCIHCPDSTVSWCESCHKDHHEGGYQSCARSQAVPDAR